MYHSHDRCYPVPNAVKNLNTYFDNSATSFPKPPEVAATITRFMQETGGTYGRSSHDRAHTATRMVETTRDLLAAHFDVHDPERLFFSHNATTALNTIIGGAAFSTVALSPLEHNSVMRPLYHRRNTGRCSIVTLPCLRDGTIDVARLKQSLPADTGLVIVNHMSNVNGLIQPIQEIREALGTIPLLVDASQSAGHLPVRCDEWGIDYCAFTGHKGLLGPTGTGGMFIRHPGSIEPLLHGGTGTDSVAESMPEGGVERFEAGTPNLAGIAGLQAALTHRPADEHRREDFYNLLESIAALKGITLLRAREFSRQGPCFSIVHMQHAPEEICTRLYNQFAIETRCGLHCAPAAHRTLETFPRGTTRFSLSPYHSAEDLEYLLSALSTL